MESVLTLMKEILFADKMGKWLQMGTLIKKTKEKLEIAEFLKLKLILNNMSPICVIKKNKIKSQTKFLPLTLKINNCFFRELKVKDTIERQVGQKICQ